MTLQRCLGDILDLLVSFVDELLHGGPAGLRAGSAGGPGGGAVVRVGYVSPGKQALEADIYFFFEKFRAKKGP